MKEPCNNKKTVVLWDVENITPSIKNPILRTVKAHLSNIDGDYVQMYAAANWGKVNPASAESLYKSGFELIHVPMPGKNAVDNILTNKAKDIIERHPEVECFILISSDSDYRRLLETIKSFGKSVYVMFSKDRTNRKFSDFLSSNMVDLALAV